MDFADTRAGLTDFAYTRDSDTGGAWEDICTTDVSRREIEVHVRFASMMKHVVAVRNSGRITAPSTTQM